MNNEGWQPIVWLTEYRTFGYLIHEGPYTSSISFNLNNEVVIEQVENDEWEYWYEHATDYESE